MFDLLSRLTCAQGYIGILDRTAMDSFADIFIAMQKKNKAKSEAGTLHLARSSSIRLIVPRE